MIGSAVRSGEIVSSELVSSAHPRSPLALTAYGLPHLMGFLKTVSGEMHRQPLGLEGLMDLAVETGHAAVDFPLRVQDLPLVPLLKEQLDARELGAVIEYMVITAAPLEDTLQVMKAARELGATVMRACLSGVLCGERRKLEGGWETQLKRVAHRLRELLPAAEDAGLCIALENHQDGTSQDFLRLFEMVDHSPSFGVTLDTGNPLAVAEGPEEYARRIAPLVRHLHLKDYTMHFAPEGYRLVRCAAGDGVIDFAAILKIVESNGHVILPGSEIAAQATRTIPILEDSWWAAYPSEQSQYLPEALRVLWQHGRQPLEPYSSAWERGENSQIVADEELDVIRRSAVHLGPLAAEYAARRIPAQGGMRP